ncbi:uncharacterized protein LOC141851640 [Brevipalpus obovatus]|uniref:uncharacterized protein LOC141851640 n=1 Tax=Brevipalpus obovatus TaxID=246614 RepID=UPI003D9EB91A
METIELQIIIIKICLLVINILGKFSITLTTIVIEFKNFHILLVFTLLGPKIVSCHGNGRVQYHEQGYNGIDSYRYGFEVSDHFNPQTRHEERDENGMVKGRYSYVEPSGRIREIHYASDPGQGFKIVKSLSHDPPTTLPPPTTMPPPPSSEELYALDPYTKNVKITKLLSDNDGEYDNDMEIDTETEDNKLSPDFAREPRLVQIAYDKPRFHRVKINLDGRSHEEVNLLKSL